MQSHGTGPITGNRQGAYPTSQSFRITRLNTTAAASTDFRLLTIEASPAAPVALRLRAVVTEAFADSGAVTLSAGTAQGGTSLLTTVDAKAAASANYAPTSNVLVFEARTALWLRLTRAGTAGGAGKVDVFAELFDVNLTVPNNNAV